MKLNVKAFALTCALIWGIGLFVLTWWIIAFEGSTGELFLIGHVYRGYNISPLGSVIGLIWGFADALIGGAMVAFSFVVEARDSHLCSSGADTHRRG